MDKQELLDELDTFYVVRKDPELIREYGDIKFYRIRGAFLRINDRAEESEVYFYTYKEDLPQELAYYRGDPISDFFARRVEDYVAEWNGRVLIFNFPKAICRILESATEGEKWVLVTDTEGVLSKEDITSMIDPRPS